LEEKDKKTKEVKKTQPKKKFSLRGWGNVKKVFKLEGAEIKSKIKRLGLSIIAEERKEMVKHFLMYKK
jgi:hypothetical protein